MCEVVQRYIDQGMAAGRIECRLSLFSAIVENMQRLGSTPEQIAAQTGVDISDIWQVIGEITSN